MFKIYIEYQYRNQSCTIKILRNNMKHANKYDKIDIATKERKQAFEPYMRTFNAKELKG